MPADKKASAIAIMFTGLTVANILGVPFGTWLGQAYGWRATFWAVTVVGIAALAVIALFVPKDNQDSTEGGSLRDELKVLARRPVLLGLLTTVLGYAGVFAVFTYIAPILTGITGFSEAAVSPILLVFGGGLVLGNLVGGKLADRSLMATLLGTLGLLAVVLAAMTLRHPQQDRRHRLRRPARRRRLRHRAAAADVGAGKGRRRRPEPGVEPQHRRVQPRQRRSAPGSAAS